MISAGARNNPRSAFAERPASPTKPPRSCFAFRDCGPRCREGLVSCFKPPRSRRRLRNRSEDGAFIGMAGLASVVGVRRGKWGAPAQGFAARGRRDAALDFAIANGLTRGRHLSGCRPHLGLRGFGACCLTGRYRFGECSLKGYRGDDEARSLQLNTRFERDDCQPRTGKGEHEEVAHGAYAGKPANRG